MSTDLVILDIIKNRVFFIMRTYEGVLPQSDNTHQNIFTHNSCNGEVNPLLDFGPIGGSLI